MEAESDTPEMTAAALAAALADIRPDLVLTGVQSSDWMGGQVGVYVAHALGLPVGYATVEVLALTEESVRIRKEIGGGRKAEMVLRLPALLCVQSGIQPLQYVSALKRRKLRGTPVRCWGTVGEADMPADLKKVMGPRAVAVGAPESRAHAEILSGDRSENAAKVLEILKKNL
ncbi:MAG: hypothetical protein HY900_35480 [Deltaproteobacteria bacterium]|nr:hypothetical protein [Deltaproteobacteria bacterium]